MRVHNYDIEDELGSGTFGVTYLGVDRMNGEYVAIKTIDVEKSEELGANIQDIKEEIDILSNLSSNRCNEHVVCYYDSFIDNFCGRETMFIVTEYIEGGSLESYISSLRRPPIPKTLYNIVLQLLLGLKYIHDNGYAHRDIKPENILITRDNVVKYIDFGITCYERCNKRSCINTCNDSGGTLEYTPPEYYNGTGNDTLESSQAHDIWSLAMVLWELVHGIDGYPFDKYNKNGRRLSENKIIYNIEYAPSYLPNYNLDRGRFNTFLDYITINDWRERPTIDMALMFFQEYVDK